MIKNILIGLLLVVVLGLFLSVYTVSQTDEAIVLRLGKIETDANGNPLIKAPGLHVKLPFIETVQAFDMRLRNLDFESSPIMTSEQKEVVVDAFVKWKIVDLVAYYKSTGGDAKKAMRLLNQKVNDGMRDEFGMQTIAQLLSDDRVKAMQTILQSVQETAKMLGIRVVDVRIRALELPSEVQDKIFARMRSARERIAAQLRADGQETAEVTRATADKERTIILSTALSSAAKIKALGDAESAKIYAVAYQQDPKFYEFWRSLGAYEQVFGQHHNILVLRPTGAFFKNFSHNDLLNQQTE